MGWRFVFDDDTYKEDDILVDQAERMEEATGSNWYLLHPLKDAKHARIVISMLVSEHTGKPYEDVESRVKAMRVNDLLAMFTVVEDDLPSEYTEGIPQEAAEPSTPT